MPSPLVLGVLSALSATAVATTYNIEDTYQGNTFLDGFDFFDKPDPTNGFVTYVGQTQAKNSQLARTIGQDTYLGVDFTTPLNTRGQGRNSVRIETKKAYTKGLFIIDVKHMPGGVCGTWPAFWSLGSGEWPKNGEIDIIEGVNTNRVNKYVLHTDTNCKTNGQGQTGAQALYDCALDSASGPSGCDVNDVAANTFGTGFNANGGGHYVMEWTDESIKMWFFPRGRLPASITANKPDTAEFGVPAANFQGDCDTNKKFIEHRFILNTALCGDWAGNTYANSGCPMYSGLNSMDSCKKFVAENPAAFRNAYWQIGSFKTFKKAPPAVSSSSSIVRSSTSSTVRSSSSTPVSSSSFSTRVSSSSSSHVSVSSSQSQSTISNSATSISSSIRSSASVGYGSSSIPAGYASSSTPVYHASSTPCTSSTPAGYISSSTPVGYASSSIPVYGQHDSSSVPVYGASSSTPCASSTSSAGYKPSSTPVGYAPSSVPVYGHSSSVPVNGASSSTPCKSSTTPVGYQSSSAPVGYASSSTPVYGGYHSASTPVYGASSSTPCKSSTSPVGYKPSSTPIGYASSSTPVGYLSSSTPVYGQYHSSSTPVGYKPSSTPVYGQYHSSSVPVYEHYSSSSASTPCASSTPAGHKPSSTPVYGEHHGSSSSVHPGYPTSTPPARYPHSVPPTKYTTKVVTNTVVETCSTGYTTKTTTHIVTYPVPHTSVDIPHIPTSVSFVLYSTPGSKPTGGKPDHYGGKDLSSTKTIYATQVVTLSVIPVTPSQYSQHVQQHYPSAPYPVKPPVSSPVYPAGGKPSAVIPGYNGTFSYGTVTTKVGSTPTGYQPVKFTGAASSLKVSAAWGGVVAAVFALL